jgi:hypothetical protein
MAMVGTMDMPRPIDRLVQIGPVRNLDHERHGWSFGGRRPDQRNQSNSSQ